LTLTDTHCHLDLEQFDADREQVVERARAAGVNRILIPGLSVASSLEALIVAQAHPDIFAAIGVHPGEVASWDAQSMSTLRELANPPYPESDDQGKVVAVGEIGLDYYREAARRELQQDVLKRQLDFAEQIGRPVVIHMREQVDTQDGECASDLIDILSAWSAGLRSRGSSLAEAPGVLHSFSGSLQVAEAAIGLGFFIGIGGPVTYKNAGERRALVAALPLERMLIETDAPYLTPAPRRGERNEPAFVRHIADKIGEIQSKHPDEVAAVTSANAARLFAWGD
jgi:TatD DNase family protein